MDNIGPRGDDRYNPGSRGELRWPSHWPLYLLTIALLGIILVGVMYVSGERQQRRELEAANQSLAASLAQVQTQLRSVNERMSDLVERTTQPPSTVRAPSKVRVPPASQTTVRA